MEKDNFIGLIFLLLLNKMQNMFNFMREVGGEDYLMEVDLIKNQMVMFMMEHSKMV